MSIAHAPPTDARRPTINPWQIAVIVLAAGLLALGTAVLIDRYSGSSSDAAEIIDALNAAVNAGDAEAVGALFARDAVLEAGSLQVSGRADVANAALIPHGAGLRLERIAPVSSEGDHAATFIQYSNGTVGVELVVFEFEDGKIVGQWIYPEHG